MGARSALRGARKRTLLVGGLLFGALVAPASAQGPALILTPTPGEVTFKIAGPLRWIPPYRIGINAQGQAWAAHSGTPWVSVIVRGADLYLSVTGAVWELGIETRHCGTVALQAFQRDELGVSTAKLADSAHVNVCVVRSP